MFFDPEKAKNFAFLRKRGGHTLSKGRFLGAQMEAYLKDGLWLTLAAKANAQAQKLADGLLGAPGVRPAWPTEVNEVFVIAPTGRAERWQQQGARFYGWPTRALAAALGPREGETLYRFVTSFETRDEDIAEMCALAMK